MEAVDKFRSENDEFVIDERCERFLMTLNSRGYLRRFNPRNAFSTGNISADNLR